ncbi:MAG: phosphoadenylyl-sulfate reductase [Crocinitomicaceae bacterium]|nr:phosphoadenylyl-sulfate reductase [Crocinitomicaceae bacterium]
MKQLIPELINELENLPVVQVLGKLSSLFPGKVVFSTSLGWEDQVITHHIAENKLPIRIFTLDTGRLFPQTYTVLSSTLQRYKTRIEVFFPEFNAVEKMMNEKGPMSFYESVENRKECCGIRKVEPLKRAIAGSSVWITGLRSEQSDNRKDLAIAEWDEVNAIIKVHPLLHWSLDDVKNEIRKYLIPYNPLHDKGFVSIGCAPCTRAIKDGEDFRAGRWWWENKNEKECGLHTGNH